MGGEDGFLPRRYEHWAARVAAGDMKGSPKSIKIKPGFSLVCPSGWSSWSINIASTSEVLTTISRGHESLHRIRGLGKAQAQNLFPHLLWTISIGKFNRWSSKHWTIVIRSILQEQYPHDLYMDAVAMSWTPE